GALSDSNIMVNDTALSADWTAMVTDDTLTLTSTGGPTPVGENITLTFTGAEGNAWISNTYGPRTIPLIAERSDGLGWNSINFVIETTPPPGFMVMEGETIASPTGGTSLLISMNDSDMAEDGTLNIDVSGLNAYLVGGALMDTNLGMNDTATVANWTSSLFGDTLTLTSAEGSTVVGETMTLTFTGTDENPWVPNTYGIQIIPLTITRSDINSPVIANISIETTPPPGYTVSADFSASPLSGMVPFTVAFLDMSVGHPTSWSWDFGDEDTSSDQNPSHTYTTAGFYMVRLTVTNEYGSDFKETPWNYIHAFNGAVKEANTSIEGMILSRCDGGSQRVTVNTSVLSATLSSNHTVLEIQPPPDRGFTRITLYAMDGSGFYLEGDTITGNLTRIQLESERIAPDTGFSAEIGPAASFYYTLNLIQYPCNARINTKILEGIMPDYDAKIRQIADKNNAGIIGTAYTATITKINLPADATLRLNMSVDSTWNPSRVGGPGIPFIWRIADDGNSGRIFPTTLLQDPGKNLDFYTANSSAFSVFGLSSFTGNNNPFQLISLLIEENAPQQDSGSDSDGGSAGTGSTVSPTPSPTTPAGTPIPPDTRVTVPLSIDPRGMILHTINLTYADGQVTVTLAEGVTALNAQGKPLESLSLQRVPLDELSSAPGNATVSFAGIAYDLQPDGATFSPPATLSVSVPPLPSGREYLLQVYDSGSWRVIPSRYDPATNTLSAELSHLCYLGVFIQGVIPETTMVATTTPIPLKPSPLSIDAWLFRWIATVILGNPLLLIGGVVVVGLIVYFGWWRRR
ncbi:MAG: PKD domain-containing protein, partial [Methanomicrobiales archaeon]|nr:PKD domain-containing protein [Methanomicrobiales archaeon]